MYPKNLNSNSNVLFGYWEYFQDWTNDLRANNMAFSTREGKKINRRVNYDDSDGIVLQYFVYKSVKK